MTSSQPYKAKEIKKRNYLELANYYIIPIVSVLSFLFIIGFPVLRNINDIRNKNSQINLKEDQIVALNKRIDNLEELKKEDPDTSAYLQTINRIVPSKESEVVTFVTDIETLAKNDSLEKVEQRTSEVNEGVSDDPFETEDISASIKSIKNAFNFKGSESEMKTFLDDLYNKKDFIIVSSLKMQGPKGRQFENEESEKQGNNVEKEDPSLADLWTIDVQFAKYIFSENFSQSITNTQVDIKTNPDEETLKLIDTRY